ncbi:hypothetical protein Salat_2090500 [Sesamum alatum]|uniref:Uncharacterized protein n=1 Tax=Sesamum alatum TaxID=300844 RepID=A0AAE2CGP5_9LAMI|nr:hypothetical protein Salat_2090500 [Sesamum alatum]
MPTRGEGRWNFSVGVQVLLKLTPQNWKKISVKSVHRGLVPKYDGPFEPPFLSKPNPGTTGCAPVCPMLWPWCGIGETNWLNKLVGMSGLACRARHADFVRIIAGTGRSGADLGRCYARRQHTVCNQQDVVRAGRICAQQFGRQLAGARARTVGARTPHRYWQQLWSTFTRSSCRTVPSLWNAVGLSTLTIADHLEAD